MPLPLVVIFNYVSHNTCVGETTELTQAPGLQSNFLELNYRDKNTFVCMAFRCSPIFDGLKTTLMETRKQWKIFGLLMSLLLIGLFSIVKM